MNRRVHILTIDHIIVSTVCLYQYQYQYRRRESIPKTRGDDFFFASQEDDESVLLYRGHGCLLVDPMELLKNPWLFSRTMMRACICWSSIATDCTYWSSCCCCCCSVTVREHRTPARMHHNVHQRCDPYAIHRHHA